MAHLDSEMFEAEGEMNIPELHRDLRRKYRNVGSKAEKLWRESTAAQRGKAMRETVGDGKVLRNSRDRDLGNLRAFLPDWNLEDITSTPDFFLDRLRFRVEADLQRQLFDDVHGGPGDREVVSPPARREAPDLYGRWAAFHDLKTYGNRFRANGPEGRRKVEEMAARLGLVVSEKRQSALSCDRP